MDLKKDKFICREIGDEIVFIPISDDIAGNNIMFSLSDDVSKFIWKRLNQNKVKEEIINEIIEQWGITKEIAEKDFEEILKQLKEHSIIGRR